MLFRSGLGMAMASPNINVYVVTSDGELMEGSCWEAIRLKSLLGAYNLFITVNIFAIRIYKIIKITI